MERDALAYGATSPGFGEVFAFPEANPHPVFQVAADGRLLYANRASEPLLASWGVDLGCSLPRLWQERVASVLASGAAGKWDEACGDRVLQIDCVPIPARGCVNVYAYDVTDRVQRTADLEATLEAISDGVAIYDREGRLLRINTAAERILGYHPVKVGLSLSERAALIRASIVDDPAAPVEQFPLPRALRGEKVSGQLMRFQPVGEAEGAQPRYVLANAVPIAGASGGRAGVVASFTDVTELRRARDELSKRVEELEALLELLPTGIGISYDIECKDIRVNPALANMLAMPPDANVSLSAAEPEREAQYRVLDQAGREMATEELPMQAAAARGTEVRDLLIDIVREDGLTRTLLSYAVPLVDAQGERRGAVGAYVDVTALRAAERELEAVNKEIRALNTRLEQRVQERTAELEAIFESVPDALYVANKSGMLRCNKPALDGFGANSVEELKGSFVTLAQRMQARHVVTGEPIPLQELGLVRALRGERAVLEMIALHPTTGKDRMYRVTAGPIVSNGEVVAAVAIASDITEQKQVGLQLAFQANLLSHINDAVVAVGLDYRITSWNHAAEQMFRWPAAEALGRPIADILPTEFLGSSAADVSQQLAEKEYWRGELLITRRDGSQVYVEATIVPVRDARGQVVGQVGVNRDISRRKAAEAENARLMEELRSSREQLRTLSRRLVALQESERSYVADQLYNEAGQVLAALQLQLARFERDGEQPAPQLPNMRATLNEAIRELHDLAAQLRPVGLDRSTLARVLSAHVAEFGRTHGIAVQFRPGDAEMLHVPADVATALYRAIQEGLSNVAQHSQATEIILTVSRDGGQGLSVTLADNGIGFDPEKASAGGSIGLASIRERLESLGGHFTITSGRGGTVLRLHAPLGPEEL